MTEPFFSYIIPTIGRSSLEIAVNSVLTQEFTRADFEVIIVNDSGLLLPAAEWQQSTRVRMINTNRSERCFARNSGAAVAKGMYLAFLDDDDWILPDALENFWQLAKRCPNADWLYGGTQIVDEGGGILAEINSGLNGMCFAQIMGGAWAPLQSSLVKASAFFAVGGFNPLISGTEDEDLCRRIAYQGELANTPEAVGCLYRGQTWSTSTNYLRAPEDTKYSRDLILAKPNALRRLIASADSSYWHGRILKVFFSTVAFNLKKKRYFNALSRFFYSLAAAGLSFPNLLSPGYWAGFRADHVPESLHFVMKEHA
jgi:glycosyltransferase involved in cell wall biosynthesis